MLSYNRIDINEVIDPTKSNNSKECMVFHYWFFNHGFKFQDSVCNNCHDWTMLCLNVSDISLITVKKVNKSKAINLLENSVLEYRGYI